MAVRFPCPHCAREMFLEPVHEGFDVPCPHCGATIAVPAGAASAGIPEPPVPPPRRPPEAGDGTLPLVFGILGLIGVLGSVCTYGCLGPLALLSPVAWVLGHRARAAALAEKRQPPGNVVAGWILGIVGTSLLAIGLFVLLAVIVFVAVSKP